MLVTTLGYRPYPNSGDSSGIVQRIPRRQDHRSDEQLLLAQRLPMIDRARLADAYAEMALRTDAAGETPGGLFPGLLLGQAAFHLPEVADPLRDGRPWASPPAATTPPFPTGRSGRSPPSESSTTGQRRLIQFREQIDTPQVSIDGKGAAPAVRDRLDQYPGAALGIAPGEDAGTIRRQGPLIDDKGALRVHLERMRRRRGRSSPAPAPPPRSSYPPAITNSEPATGTGRRLPLASGSPSSMR